MTKRTAFAAALLAALQLGAANVVDELERASVTVDVGQGAGSGTIFTRERDGTVYSFVWTAGHVVEPLRSVEEKLVGGETRKEVSWDDAKVVRKIYQDSRRVGEIAMDARVLRYSGADRGHDLALLLVRKRDFVDSTVEFAGENPPRAGSEVYHVGSLLGEPGASSLTQGIVSKVGRTLDGKVYNQIDATAWPGSSGGGVFLKSSGEYVGMVTRGARGGDNFNFMVPVRRVRSFAEDVDAEWAIDDGVSLPKEFSYRSSSESGDGDSPNAQNFFLEEEQNED